MAYIKNTWVDQNVERPRTYELQNNTDGSVTFIDSFGNVTELGTPVNADNMNHIEEGIYSGSFTKYDANGVYEMNDLVTVIEDGSPVIYKSLQDDNKGNTLSDTTYWEKISLGGGGGLEIGDIGIAPLGIDETKGKRRYLNGQVIIQEQYVQFTNKVKSAVALYPSLACTETEWQTTATMTVGGQVGKFVVDDDAGTIRLPKIIMPIQGLTDLSKLAEIVEAGLPNITGSLEDYALTYNGGSPSYTGAFSAEQMRGTLLRSGSGDFWTDNDGTIKLNASLSNPIYGNSNTVQQEQIQYPYFIQVATGAETEDNIINEIELNNPFSLLDYKYSEYELNNLSWLRSNGQYNSKAIYPAVYDLLLKIYNGTETKAGVSVKLHTETFTDYDFVLNTAEETFRLPLKVKMVGGGDALVEVISTTGLGSDSSKWAFMRDCRSGNSGIGNATPQYLKGGLPYLHNVANSEYYYDPNGTLKLDLSNATNDDLYLYFYVGETVQNANLINAGRIEEKLTDISVKVENVISNNKNLIEEYSTSAIMPDYTTAVAVTTKTYTAPYKGWLVGLCATSGNTTSTGYINNVLISQEYGDYQDIQILMDKGDVFTTGASEVKLNFCALKGAK